MSALNSSTCRLQVACSSHFGCTCKLDWEDKLTDIRNFTKYCSGEFHFYQTNQLSANAQSGTCQNSKTTVQVLHQNGRDCQMKARWVSDVPIFRVSYSRSNTVLRNAKSEKNQESVFGLRFCFSS